MTAGSGNRRSRAQQLRSASEEEVTSQLISWLALRAGVNHAASTEGATSKLALRVSVACFLVWQILCDGAY